jgi:hypothetical protein
MSWHARFEQEVHRRHPGAGIWYTRVSSQPGWVIKTAMGVALLVVVVPVVLLTLAAVFVGVTCLLALSLVAAIVRGVSGLFQPATLKSQDDGRRNVRVIHRP